MQPALSAANYGAMAATSATTQSRRIAGCRQRRSLASQRPRIDSARIARIEVLLAEDFSAEQIAGSTGLARHEWIYQRIYADQKRGGCLLRRLRRRRRQWRRRGLRDGRGQLPHQRRWTARPAIVEQCARLGDWELDTTHHCPGIESRLLLRRSALALATRQQRKCQWAGSPVPAQKHGLQHYHRSPVEVDRSAPLHSTVQDTWIQNTPRRARGFNQQRCKSESNSLM